MFVLQYSCIVTHIPIYQPVVWDSIYLDQLPRTIRTHLWFRRARRSFPPLFQASGICHTACLICSIRFRDDRQSTVFWYVWFDGFHNGPSLRERNFLRLELFSLSVHWMGLDSSRVERATFEGGGKADHDDDDESDEADSAESDNGVPCEQPCHNVMLQHLSLDLDFLFLVGLYVTMYFWCILMHVSWCILMYLSAWWQIECRTWRILTVWWKKMSLPTFLRSEYIWVLHKHKISVL